MQMTAMLTKYDHKHLNNKKKNVHKFLYVLQYYYYENLLFLPIFVLASRCCKNKLIIDKYLII